MDYITLDDDRTPATATVSCFRGASGVTEWHLLVRPSAPASAAQQFAWVELAYNQALARLEIPRPSAILRRIFCSDPRAQQPILANHPLAQPADLPDACALSWIGQPPQPPATVALWAYHLVDPTAPVNKKQAGSTTLVQRGDLAHLWTTGLIHPEGDAYAQTQGILRTYAHELRRRGLTLADHTLRTWLFVKDIDHDYSALVAARREFFTAQGLTSDTHFLASTGIQGAGIASRARIVMDAYAVAGVRPEQIRHLAAPDHLSPTHLYGVTFERGTAVSYRDRRQVILSGTASIDAHGEIVHPHDVAAQLERTLANMSALLAQAGATLADMTHFIVYLRATRDGDRARRFMARHVGHAPTIIVTAPVCRPGWLVEVEGWATVAAHHPDLPPF